MQVRDVLGNSLEVGTVVSVVVGDELGLATVKKIDSGLGLEGTASQPAIFLEIYMQRQVLPNGIAVGVLAVIPPKEPPKLVEA